MTPAERFELELACRPDSENLFVQHHDVIPGLVKRGLIKLRFVETDEEEIEYADPTPQALLALRLDAAARACGVAA